MLFEKACSSGVGATIGGQIGCSVMHKHDASVRRQLKPRILCFSSSELASGSEFIRLDSSNIAGHFYCTDNFRFGILTAVS